MAPKNSDAPLKTAKSESIFRRFFTNPKTGELAIVQMPNIPLAIFFLATAARLALHPHGRVGSALSVVTGISIVWWAVDEVVRGDSLFRRVLGGVVLAGILMRLLMG